MRQRVCLGRDCLREDIVGYGYCNKHYQRYNKYGDAEIVRHSTGGVDVSINSESGLPNYVEEKIARQSNGCWLWKGSLSVDGYGAVRYKKQLWACHRLVYVLLKGEFDLTLELDHKFSHEGCQRHCVNPDHLEPVTSAENKRRAKLRRTHCPNGHEYIEDNIYMSTYRGYTCRRCKICVRAASARYKEHKLKGDVR